MPRWAPGDSVVALINDSMLPIVVVADFNRDGLSDVFFATRPEIITSELSRPEVLRLQPGSSHDFDLLTAIGSRYESTRTSKSFSVSDVVDRASIPEAMLATVGHGSPLRDAAPTRAAPRYMLVVGVISLLGPLFALVAERIISTLWWRRTAVAAQRHQVRS